MRNLKMILFCGDQIAEHVSPLGDFEAVIEFEGKFYFASGVKDFGINRGDCFLIHEITSNDAVRWANKTFADTYAAELTAEIEERAH